jgi:hypothetical protein
MRISIMPCRVALALAMAMFLSAAGSAPRPKAEDKPVPFVPTTPEDAWVVVSPKGVARSWVVTEAERKEGALLVTTAEVGADGKHARTVTYEVTAATVCRVAEDGKPLPAPDCLLKLPPTPGAKWEQPMFAPDGTRLAETAVRKVVGEEEVETPAGKFKAVRVDMEYPAGRPWSKSWYAQGRGVVMTDFGGSAFKLKSFTPAGKK